MQSVSRRGSVVGASIVMIYLAVQAAAQPPAAPAGPSLYKRLGGFDAIAAVVDDFVPRLVGDPQVGRFFTGHANDSKMRVRELAIELICQATGGPCVYIGRPMKTAHAGLGISESDWTIATKHLTATLEKLKVPANEQTEFLALVTSLKKDIVEKP